METGFSSKIAWISVGDPIEMGQRDIYPVARVSALKECGCIMGCSVSPEVLLIVEPAQAYAVSLTSDEITLDQIMAMAPSLREIVEKRIGKKYEERKNEEER